MWRLRYLLFLGLLCRCESDNAPPPEQTGLMESITSASVAFAYSDATLQEFLESPSLAYISGYFYFEDNLAPTLFLDWT